MKHEPVDMAGGKLCIRTGWLIDGSGGPVQTDHIITIHAGWIESVAPYRQGQHTGCRCMDLRHCTVLPALMDAHVHLTFSGTLDPAFRMAQLQQDADDDLIAVGRHLGEHWRHGVAVVRHAGDRRGVLLGAAQRPRSPVEVKVTSWAWHGQGRYGRMIGRSHPDNQSLHSAVGAVSNGLDHIKVINSGINSLDRFGHQSAPQFALEELQRVCRYAQKKDMPVMVHANGRSAVRDAIYAGCSSIEHGFFMGRDNLCRMADNGVVWVPTAIAMAALARSGVVSSRQREVAHRTLEHQLEQIRQGRETGVTIALGTDAGSMGVDHGVAVSRELALLMQAGFSLTQAVRCATRNAAGLMGFNKRGGIFPGFQADILAVEGPPGDLPGSLGRIHRLFSNRMGHTRCNRKE
jgi:imidazolonepropionase-like amidohydrolase